MNTINLEEKRMQFDAEKEIATLLLKSNKKLRRKLYSIEYDRFFKMFPNHSSVNSKDKENAINQEILIVKKIMTDNNNLLEIGAGDSLFARKACQLFKNVIAIDVSSENNNLDFPINYKQIICNGIELPVEYKSIDFIFSNQVAEHLHPEDLEDQTKMIYKCLKYGGIYEIVTPHRYRGPHDVSKYFSSRAEGLHLKEYTIYEIYKILKKIGFKKINLIFKIRGLIILVPVALAFIIENIFRLFPDKIRKKILNKILFKQFFFIRLVGIK